MSIFYSYAESKTEDASLENLAGDAKAVSSYLISSGHPDNWSISNVAILGLTNSNGRIDASKLLLLEGIGYSKARTLLNTKYDFFIYFLDKASCVIKINDDYGFGHPDAELEDKGSSESCLMQDAKNMSLDLSEINPKKLVKIERLAVHNSTISKMVLHEWEK